MPGAVLLALPDACATPGDKFGRLSCETLVCTEESVDESGRFDSEKLERVEATTERGWSEVWRGGSGAFSIDIGDFPVFP